LTEETEETGTEMTEGTATEATKGTDRISHGATKETEENREEIIFFEKRILRFVSVVLCFSV
jgi:hypothetical protein